MSAPRVYDALTIADEILRIAKEKGEQLTPLKLMKLTYIAQGWALALSGRDLFRNRIEAWQYGPVIPDLYRATKSYGRSPIPLALIKGEASVDDDTLALLKQVYERYVRFTAIGLSSLTHQSGTPWDQVYDAHHLHTEIPRESIREHYEQLRDRPR